MAGYLLIPISLADWQTTVMSTKPVSQNTRSIEEAKNQPSP